MAKSSSVGSNASCVVLPAPPPSVRRRSLLKAGASARALIAVQAAMSVGILLTAPAHAQTNISPTGSGVSLSTTYGAGDNPFNIGGGTLVSSSGIAIFGTSTSSWTLTNLGTVHSGGTTGIDFAGLGFVTNEGTVGGQNFGVYIGTGGTVSNSGTITGNAGSNGDGVRLANNDTFGSVFNSGSIGGYVAVQLSGGGYLSNASGGIIQGNIGVYTDDAAATIYNDGLIKGTAGVGLHLNTGGTVTNDGDGTITGTSNGLLVTNDAGTLYNHGSVLGTTDVVKFTDAGYVDNTGTIMGGTVGVSIAGSLGVVRNNGFSDANYISGSAAGVVISATAGTLLNRGLVVSSGTSYGDAAVIMNGGYIYNQTSNCATNAGTISGVEGIFAHGTSAITIVNAGLIQGFGTYGGSSLVNGAAAIDLGSAGGYISNASNGVIQSPGAAAIYAHNGSLSVVNAGVIQGGSYGIEAYNTLFTGGSATISNSGTVFGSATGVYVGTGFGSVANSGVIAGQSVTGVGLYNGGYVNNTGSIVGGQVGVSIAGTVGIVYNNGFGDDNYIHGTYAGVIISAAGGTLINHGLISQSGTNYSDAAVIMSGGYIYNRGSNCAGNLGQIIGYSNGLIANGTTAITINNQGVIEGTANEYHIGSDGVILGTFGGEIINGPTAQIDAAGGDAISSVYGSFSVNNAGQILGYHGDGIDSYIPYSGSFGNGAVTVVNSGLIGGTRNGIYIGTGAGSVFNTGLIGAEYENGIYLYQGGTVFSGTLGVIEGGYNGIIARNSYTGVVNFGSIQGHDGDGVALFAGGSVGNFTTFNGNFWAGTIAGQYDGVYIGGGAGWVSNSGIINGTIYNGVELHNGGSVTNFGGSITGAYSGVKIGYSGERNIYSGEVFNDGVIRGNTIAGVVMYGGGYLRNYRYGLIVNSFSTGYGVAMYTPDSTVINNGNIRVGRFGQGVRFYNGGFLYNNGEIVSGLKGSGVYLRDGGSVANAGYIYGGFGVRAGTMASASIDNIGYIKAHTIGVQLNGGGYINNDFVNYGCDQIHTGGIYGRQIGVQINKTAGTVINYGYIGGGAQQTYGIGVQLTNGGVVANVNTLRYFTQTSGGIIGGDVGVAVSGQPGFVYNSGYIHGGTIGVALYNGGSVDNALFVRTFANYCYDCATYTASSAGEISGGKFGVYAGSLASASVTNAGFIHSTGYAAVGLLGGGGVTNLSTGLILGGYAGVLISGQSGYVSNAGVINGETGVYIPSGGTVINLAGASIGGLGGVFIGHYAGQTVAAVGTVLNSGTIGAVYIGVKMTGGGYLSNSSTGRITALHAVDIYGSVNSQNTVINAGTIIGYEAGGVSLYGPGTFALDNQAGGTIFGGSSGVVVFAQKIGVTNAGSISGDLTGVYIGYASLASVTNLAGGTITGYEFQGVFVRHDSLAGSTSISNAGSISGPEEAIDVVGGSYAGIANLAGGSLYAGGPAVYAGRLGVANVTNMAGGLIVSADYTGVLLESVVSANVVNAGSINADRDGVVLYGVNTGYVGNQSGGTITAGNFGIYIQPGSVAGSATIVNAGMVLGENLGVVVTGATYASVTNRAGGTITGYDDGVSLDAGINSVVNSGLILGYGGDGNNGLFVDGTRANIANQAGGTIAGPIDGVHAETAYLSLQNAGSIGGANFAGVYGDGVSANITNAASGTITGGIYGVLLTNGYNTLDNAGLIMGETGVSLFGSVGSVINRAGGTIYGSTNGLGAQSSYFSLDNSGLITAGSNLGVALDGTLAAQVVNEAGGTIAGPSEAVRISNGTLANVFNYGLITSGQYGVDTEDGAGRVINYAGGIILGGYTGVFTTGSLIGNAGYIGGASVTGADLVSGGTLINTGTITGGGIGVESAYTGASIASLGTVLNGGLISGGSAGVQLEFGGLVSNQEGGVITGGTYGVQAGYNANSLASPGTVFNAGTITGGTAGVVLNAGGSVTNMAGGTISGGAVGVNIIGAGYVGNAGLIAGGTTGVAMTLGGTLQNSGVISGGQDGVDGSYEQPTDVTNSGTIIGTAGTGLQLAGGSLDNLSTGLIQGGTDGVIAGSGSTIVNAGTIADSPAPGHAGVLLSGTADLTNLPTGTISGEVGVLVSGNDATIVDEGSIISTDGGDAIQVLPNVDPVQITLTSGSSVTGTIDGGGTAGQITLTGNNILPNTIANFGTGSALTVAPGASWTGTGNWTIANVNNTGTFQAGQLNVPLNLTGNFNNMGTLQIIVTPTVSTQFNVSGTATLTGNLTYVFAPGTYIPGTTYSFLNANGGATGGFSSVTYVGATPVYVGKTTNVPITGFMIGSNLVLGRVAPLDDSVFADLNQDSAQNAQSANDELLGKAAGDSGANAAACAAAESVMPNRATSPHGTNTASQMTGAVANAFCGAGGWIEATGSTMNVDNSADALGYSANEAGFLAGVDRPVNGFGTKLGLAVGYDDAWLNDKAKGKATADTVRVGLYATQPLGAFTLAADIMYGHANDTTTRSTGVGAASASFGGNVFNGGVQVSTGLNMQGLELTPAAGVKFAAVDGGSFTETAPAALAAFKVTGHSSSYTSVQPYVNLGLSKSFVTESLVTITPEASVGYTLEAGDRGKAVNVVAPDGTVFGSGHTNLDEGGAQIEAGISAGKNNWALYAKYEAFVSGNWTAQAGEAGLQIKF